jgi:zeta-carotene desaturase
MLFRDESRPATGPIRDVLVIGAGLAGLSAACALADVGYSVQIMERRPYPGGRASSYEHPGTGEVIDNCQHLLLGCCTNLIHFYKRAGVANEIRWYDHFTFVEPGGRRSTIRPSGLPAPFHSAMSFMGAPMLRLEDKIAIIRGLWHITRGGIPSNPEEPFINWLSRHRQTARAIDHFWKPTVVSALNDELDAVSTRYGCEFFFRAFLKSPEASRMGIASVPLSQLYAEPVEYLRRNRGEVHYRATADGFSYDPGRKRWTASSSDGNYEADAIIFAVPFEGMRKLLPLVPGGSPGAVEMLRRKLDHLEPSSITGIHLWFDRHITDLEHAALLDSPVQWIFQKSKLQPGVRQLGSGSYVELVISSSGNFLATSRQQLLDIALEELPRFFPAMLGAKLEKSAVVKEVHATFRVGADVDAYRPAAVSPWPRIFLAGDWTDTGWPSTMEGAVRSGYLAAEALTESDGRIETFLQPDLPPDNFVRRVANPMWLKPQSQRREPPQHSRPK